MRCNGVEMTSLDAQEAELLCLICQEEIWCISLVQDTGNLSRHYKATQDRQNTVDAGNTTQDAQDAGDADCRSCVSGCYSAVSHAVLGIQEGSAFP